MTTSLTTLGKQQTFTGLSIYAQCASLRKDHIMKHLLKRLFSKMIKGFQFIKI